MTKRSDFSFTKDGALTPTFGWYEFDGHAGISAFLDQRGDESTVDAPFKDWIPMSLHGVYQIAIVSSVATSAFTARSMRTSLDHQNRFRTGWVKFRTD